jgi:hypothetical protein
MLRICGSQTRILFLKTKLFIDLICIDIIMNYNNLFTKTLEECPYISDIEEDTDTIIIDALDYPFIENIEQWKNQQKCEYPNCILRQKLHGPDKLIKNHEFKWTPKDPPRVIKVPPHQIVCRSCGCKYSPHPYRHPFSPNLKILNYSNHDEVYFDLSIKKS